MEVLEKLLIWFVVMVVVLELVLVDMLLLVSIVREGCGDGSAADPLWMEKWEVGTNAPWVDVEHASTSVAADCKIDVVPFIVLLTKRFGAFMNSSLLQISSFLCGILSVQSQNIEKTEHDENCFSDPIVRKLRKLLLLDSAFSK